MKNFSVLQVIGYLDLSLKSLTKTTEKPVSPAVSSLHDQLGRSFTSATFADSFTKTGRYYCISCIQVTALSLIVFCGAGRRGDR